MVFITENIASELESFLSSHNHDKVFVLTDENTYNKCFRLLSTVSEIKEAKHITIKADDTNKNIEQVATIWEILSTYGASRNSLLINLGGGMITEIGRAHV